MTRRSTQEQNSPVDPEIRDQLWILNRVHQKYQNDCYFCCVVALSYLIGKLGKSVNTKTKTSVSVLEKAHSHERRKLFPTLAHLELSECGRAFV